MKRRRLPRQPFAERDGIVTRDTQERQLAILLNDVHESYLPTTMSVYGPPSTGNAHDDGCVASARLGFWWDAAAKSQGITHSQSRVPAHRTSAMHPATAAGQRSLLR